MSDVCGMFFLLSILCLALSIISNFVALLYIAKYMQGKSLSKQTHSAPMTKAPTYAPTPPKPPKETWK